MPQSEDRIHRIGMTDSETAAYERGKLAGLELAELVGLHQPGQRVWQIEFCYPEYEKFIDKVPSARQTLTLSGDATLGMIGAMEDAMEKQKFIILSSQPKMLPA